MALEVPVEDPWYAVTYDGVGIHEDISGLLTELVYTDVEHGESDTLEITCEDRYHHFKKEWFPCPPATLTAEIGYEDGRRLKCGTFQLDETTWAARADTVRIKALATIITPHLRTREGVGYDQTSLKEIVETVAKRNGLEPRHDIDPKIRMDRVTQNHERDLPFLTRLAEDYNYAFTVRGHELHFWYIPTLEKKGPVLTYQRTDLKQFCLSLQSEETAPQGEVCYQDPDGCSPVKGCAGGPSATGDTYRRLQRAPTQDLAERQAEGRLHNKDKRWLAGTITVVGDVRLVAGINLLLVGLFKLDGKYHVESTAHRLARGLGYETQAQIYRVSPPIPGCLLVGRNATTPTGRP